MQKNNIFVYAIIALTVIAFGIIIIGAKNGVGTTENGLTIDQTLAANDHVVGATTTPKATFVEYSDPQCPACAYYWPIVKQLVATYGNDVRFVFRYFPLPQHQNALFAMGAIEAASKQGKFYEMEDILFTNQTTWETAPNAHDLIIGYADTLKLDKTQFLKDLNDPATASRINADSQAAVALGINHTPTFFLNGKEIVTAPQDYAGFAALIDAAIK